MPRWAISTGVLIGVYLVVIIAAALWIPHEWDWRALQWLGSRVTPTFSPEVTIVDVTWSSDIASDRRRIADFLDGLVRSNRRPNAVILDVEFGPCQSNPCGAPMTSARAELIASIRAAARRFPVYATEEPGIDRNDDLIGPLDPQDSQIYEVLSGAAQTKFTVIPNAGGLFYRICYANVPFVNELGEVQGKENVWAMTVRALMTPRAFANAPPCDSAHVPVRLGPAISAERPTVYPFTNARTFSGYSQFDDRTFVIVGTIRYDRLPFTDRSGPEMLGWALSNALDQGSLVGKSVYYDVAPQNAMLLFLVPFFSGLAVLAYVAAFHQLRRLRLRGLRGVAPWFAAGAAATVGLGIFAIFELWLFFSHHLQPQISLIALGIVAACGLSGMRGVQILRDEAATISAGPPDAYDYDVFISYAHDDAAWVLANVVRPFQSARLDGGKRLSIFFDTSSIRSGTGWQTALALAIDGSRFIVPVYSEAYFRQPYCRFEIMRAHRKWVVAGEASRCVLPVMLGHPAIPAAVDDIQARSVDDHPEVVEQHVAEIVERLSREGGHSAAEHEGAIQ